jgi:glycosyltransferase involved in cell wall biosynthesis
MKNLIVPHGSRRRKKAKELKLRIKYSRAHRFSRRHYNRLRSQHYALQNNPKPADETIVLSIVVPCYNTPQKYFLPLLDSVFAQKYGNWELVIIDASDDAERSAEIKQKCGYDSRITYTKVVNKGIAENTNVGIKSAAGDYICFLDHDDTLDPYALYENAKAIAGQDPDLIYSDEDKLSESGDHFFEPHFKPDFSLDLLRSVNYITHFVCVKKSVAEKAGLIRPDFEGAQDYDFLLRVVDITKSVYHIPKVLYHWRQADNSTAANFNNKKHVLLAGERALNDHYGRNKTRAMAQGIKNRPGFYQTFFELDPAAKRAVVFNFPPGTPQKIKDFIRKKYKKSHEVKEGQISLLEINSLSALPLQEYDHILLVQDLIAPTRKDASLNNLFGLLENGADYTTARQITGGRIVNCGYVYDRDGELIPLFGGFDPSMPSYFGSHEWTRNIDAVPSTLVGFNTAAQSLPDFSKHTIIGEQKQRLVCFGEYDYQLFGDYQLTVQGRSRYFNPNLTYETKPCLRQFDIAAEKLDIKE